MARLGDDNIDDLELSGVHLEVVVMAWFTKWSSFLPPLLCLVV
jgi:hypothetical protein